MGLFGKKLIDIEHSIWLDRVPSWIPYGFQAQLATLPCDVCSVSGFTKAGHGGIKVWQNPTGDVPGPHRSLTQENALYFYQHLNDYYSARRAGEGVESAFLTSTPREEVAAKVVAEFLRNQLVTAAPGEPALPSSKGLENLAFISKELMSLRPGLTHLIEKHECESKHRHDALVVYPPALEKLKFGTGSLAEVPDHKSLALFVYECGNNWYVSNSALTVHNKFSELVEPSWIKFVPFELSEIVGDVEEVWASVVSPNAN